MDYGTNRNMLKKIYILLMVSCGMTMAVNGQKIGIEGSYTADILAQEHKGDKDNVWLNGWNVALRYEQSLNEPRSLGLNVGLGWEMAGGRYGVEWYEPYTTCTRFMHYLSVPIDIMYYVPLDKKNRLKFMVYGGTRLYVGMAGDYDHHYYMATKDYNPQNPFGDSKVGEKMHRWDVGVGLGVGIEFYGLYAKVGYDCPLTNSARDYAPTSLYQHRVHATLGYSFDLKKYIERNRIRKGKGESHSRRSGAMALPDDKAMPGMNEREGFKRR